MKKIIIIALTIIVLAILNYSIFEKEQIRKNGEIVYLELRPADPRSIMQGDYMRLRYKIEQGEHTKDYKKIPPNGAMVILSDAHNIAHFVRIHQGEKLEGQEKLIPYHRRYRTLKIKPDSFFFQEGHAKKYEQAKYGIFKFLGPSSKLLVGLADKDLKQIRPEEEKSSENNE